MNFAELFEEQLKAGMKGDTARVEELVEIYEKKVAKLKKLYKKGLDK